MNSAEWVVVYFHDPVEGTDVIDGEHFTSDRHRVRANHMTQDATTTAFIDEGGVIVSEWATEAIERVEWSSPRRISGPGETKPRTGSVEWLAGIREEYPNAYASWSFEEEEQLARAFEGGASIASLSRSHQRRPGAISSRLRRLGLISAGSEAPR